VTVPTDVPDCPKVPDCASAAVLERTNAAISAIVASFMVDPFSLT
jgi:hypothetical protein